MCASMVDIQSATAEIRVDVYHTCTHGVALAQI